MTSASSYLYVSVFSRKGSKLILDNYGFELLLLLLLLVFFFFISCCASVAVDSSTVGCSCRKLLRDCVDCVIVLLGVHKNIVANADRAS